MRASFEPSGSLASVDVLAAICGIGRRKESGTLQAAGPAGESVRFGFAEGVLVALDPPPEVGPADVLIRAGKVQRATYEALTVGDFEDRFAVAAASGVISRREANWGLKISAIESLVRVLSWSDGEYAYEEGDPELTAPPLKLRIDQWVLELFLRSNDRGFVVRKIGPADVPVARAEGFAESFGALGLTADADAVVEGVDGRHTVDEIVKRSRADEFATLKLLAALITLGLVLPIHEMPETAEAESPRPAVPELPVPGELDAGEPEVFELALPLDVAARPAEAGPNAEAEIAAEPDAEPPSAEEPPAEAAWETETFEAPAAEFEPEPPGAGAPPDSEAAEPFDAIPEETRPLPEISVPLFALTAPEHEPAPAPDRDEPLPAGETDAHRRVGGLRAAAVFAILAIAGVLLVVRRRAAPRPPEPARPPAEASARAPIRPAAQPETAGPSPATSPSAPEAVRKTAERPPAGPPPSPAPKPSAAPDGTAKKSPPPPRAPVRNERADGKGGSWEALARAGRQTFDHPGAHRYAIQLELACEESTLQKAFAADPGRRQIWVAPYSFRGRSCYRVLWGKYRDLGSAKAAKAAVPEIFSRDGNRPAVVPLGRAK
jgi:hypothetical protein